ncbi:hypothetical protein O6H91_Y239400 [Diphasiastrum complanatum]|nr:hypothetical protein O6H91_Y239400 [Diphasiastrum complanatum]
MHMGKRSFPLSEQPGIIGHSGEASFRKQGFDLSNNRHEATFLSEAGNAVHMILNNVSNITGLDGVGSPLGAKNVDEISNRSGKRTEQSKQNFEQGIGTSFYNRDHVGAQSIGDVCLDEGFLMASSNLMGSCLHPCHTEHGKGLNKNVIKLKDMARGKGSDVSGTTLSSGKQKLNVSGGQHPAKMVLALVHEGEVTWDLKWQPVGDIPGEEADDRESLRLGILALILGDGSLQVLDVPNPNILKALWKRKSRDDPTVVKIQPVLKCSDLRSGGHKSIPLTVEWSTSKPHDMLLAGCHDGTVAVWKFEPKGVSCSETRPIMFFTADNLPLRTIAWAPDGRCFYFINPTLCYALE